MLKNLEPNDKSRQKFLKKCLDIVFVREVGSISISQILRNLKISKSNFYKGKVSAEKTHEVAEILEKELKRILENRNAQE